MVSNSSEFQHYAPPLLRAFNLSNQLFSLHHDGEVTIFNILTKSPAYPSLSFIPKRHFFNHFTSTASSSIPFHPLPLPKTTQAGSFIPPAVGASFLSQIWREVEVETMLCSAPHTNAAQEPSVSSDEFNESESLTEEIAGSASADTLLPWPWQETSEKELNVSQDFSLKLDEEGDVTALSGYPFHGCVQTFIRLRSIRIIHEECSQKDKTVRLDAGSSNSFLREGPEEKSQHDINEVPIEESKAVLEVRLSSSHFYAPTVTIDNSEAKNNYLIELVSTREIQLLTS